MSAVLWLAGKGLLSLSEEKYAVGMEALRAGRSHEAAATFESLRGDPDWAEQAAYELGVLCTALELSREEVHGYAMKVARGQGNLEEMVRSDATVIPDHVRVRSHPAQLLAIRDGRAFAGWWNPIARSLTLHPEWVSRWLELLLSGKDLNEVELIMAKSALAVQLHLSTQTAGPPALPRASQALTGFGSYRQRWAKGWEDGICQVATESFFEEYVRHLQLPPYENLQHYEPIPLQLAAEEGLCVNLLLTWLAQSENVDPQSIVRKLAAEFPDTRPAVLVDVFSRTSPSTERHENESPLGKLLYSSFDNFAMEHKACQSTIECAYAIAYRPFLRSREGEDVIDADSVHQAQQALSTLLPQATSFDEVGAILGQGGSLATLRALAENQVGVV